MKLKIIDFVFGSVDLKAEGTFAERVLNIAKEKGIFIQHIDRKDDKTLVFTVSRKGAKALLGSPLPDDISLNVISSFGLPALFSNKRSRRFFILAPIAIFTLLICATQFIWHVNVVGADPATEKHILSELKRLGVYKGALKHTINQTDIKDDFLVSNPDYLWIWVDLRGSSAIVKFAPRDPSPPVFDEDTFYNVYSTRDAVITRIIATNGVAKVNVGDTVLKGQILIEGSMQVAENERAYLHASGEVYGNVWEEKTIYIPKKREIRTPTGEKTEHLSINFSKFNIKLYINSSILYPNYDMIEMNRYLPIFGVNFNKKDYHKVNVTYEDNDISALTKKHEDEFFKSLTDSGFTITYTQSDISDAGEGVYLTIKALCEEPIGIERRMDLGENYSVSDY